MTRSLWHWRFPVAVGPLVTALALLIGAVPDARAQAVLVPGESRANSQQYLTSHNSYQGDISTADALDRYNVSALELDVRWRDNAGCTDSWIGFYVIHHCGDLDGAASLRDHLIVIASTKRMQDGFFFLNLELEDGYVCLGCFEGPSFPGDYLDQLEDLLRSVLGASAIYTWPEFEADGKQWPSVQELRRRGKRVAIHANFPDSLAAGRILFKRASVFGTVPPIAWWNTEDPNAAIPPTGDRFMTRRYPEAYCVLEDGSAWGASFNNGFNFPSTNCIEFHATNNSQFFQPPLPTYVTATGTGGLGTHREPYAGGPGLLEACQRASFYDSYTCPGAACKPHPTTVAIELAPGIYTATGAGSATLSCPVTLTAPDGTILLD